MKTKPTAEIANILNQSLIYGIFIDNRIIYIGTTNVLLKRIESHLHKMAYYEDIRKSHYEIMYKFILLDKFPVFKIIGFGDYVEEKLYINKFKNKMLINIFLLNKYLSKNFINKPQPKDIKKLLFNIHNSNIMLIINQCNQIKLCKTTYLNTLI